MINENSQFTIQELSEKDKRADLLFNEMKFWQKDYRRIENDLLPSIEKIETSGPVILQKLRRLGIWRSAVTNEDEVEIIKDQLKTHVKPNDIDVMPFNLCDSQKGRDKGF